MITSLTFKQQSNYEGFPKAAELIEIEGANALESLRPRHVQPASANRS